MARPSIEETSKKYADEVAATMRENVKRGEMGYARTLQTQHREPPKMTDEARLAALSDRERELTLELEEYRLVDPYLQQPVFAARREAIEIELRARAMLRANRERANADEAAAKAFAAKWLPLPGDFVDVDDAMLVAAYVPGTPSAQLTGRDGRMVAFRAAGPNVALVFVPAAHRAWADDAISLQRKQLGPAPTASHVTMLTGDDRFDPRRLLMAANISVPTSYVRETTSWFFHAIKSTRTLVRLARMGPGLVFDDATLREVAASAARWVSENVAGAGDFRSAIAFWAEHDRAAAIAKSSPRLAELGEITNAETNTATEEEVSL